MLAAARVGIAAVGHRIAVRGQEVSLRDLRPAFALELAGIPMVVRANLLQANQVGVEFGHPLPQGVNLQPLGRPSAAHTLVNVVGGHTQGGSLSVFHGAAAATRFRPARLAS